MLVCVPIHAGRRLERRAAFVLALIVVLAVAAVFMAELSIVGNPVFRVSAVQTSTGIGVYWNPDCSLRAASINWSTLTPSGTKRVTVYVRNEGNESFALYVTPVDWVPQNASSYLSFSWASPDCKILAGKTLSVTLALHVSSGIRGITDFSFSIVFEGLDHFLGDINRDGSVNLHDLVALGDAYGSSPGHNNWNANADLNGDGVVNLRDLYLFMLDYGKSF
jgi:hypothetical protein